MRDNANEYIAQMRAEAEKRRSEANEADDEGLRRWLLKRAEFFDTCADERASEAKSVT